MKTKQMISSYDEINDTFVAKISDKDGYYANYDIADGIFLNIDKNGFPVSRYKLVTRDEFIRITGGIDPTTYLK